jgi:membrane protease YdiL (CAAX protease family)
VTPLQELIVRGGLQGPLEVFLTEKNSTIKAIIVSNLMFATVHLFLGMDIAILVFFAGLYFGWLYSRHHTLIGVILAHGILGTWATMIIGL